MSTDNDTGFLTRLQENSPFSMRELEILILTAPERYKEHNIQKRHGRGLRLISQPTAEIKFLQKILMKYELSNLPVHKSATAYRRGSSIKEHAQIHARESYLLKLDFKDFFPSIKADSLEIMLAKNTSYSAPELKSICRILCRNDHKSDELKLSIGAPSSPYISNYFLHEFDAKLFNFCEIKKINYTRYADDIALSTSEPKLLDLAYQEVKNILVELSYLGLTLNKDKTINVSRKNRKTLVGLRLGNDGGTSIGRNEKRKLRATMHYYHYGLLAPENIAWFRGYLSFVHSIDPSFVQNLCQRYNIKELKEIEYVNENN